MAEKEERILITTRHKNEKLNMTFTDMYKEYTRQEAVERMAKAICASNMAPDCLWECETCDRWKGSDKEEAEAALDALLGGKK